MRRNDQAVIEIADTGSGIPAERLNTIFDDYYTTWVMEKGLKKLAQPNAEAVPH